LQQHEKNNLNFANVINKMSDNLVGIAQHVDSLEMHQKSQEEKIRQLKVLAQVGADEIHRLQRP
jgi:hypothetical protein